MIVTLIVGHEVDAPRKVGFHFWTEYLNANNHHVNYISVGNSYLSKLQGKRIPLVPNRWISHSKLLDSYSWVPPFHPCLNKTKIKKFFMPLFRRYNKFFSQEHLERIKNSDVIIVESGQGLTLIPRIRKICPNAYIVYEVSDRLRTVGAHPVILEAERTAIPLFDFIRVPAEIMKSDFSPSCPIEFIPQGMDKADFDIPHPSPYLSPKNAVSIGDMLFDERAICTFARNFPDWTFHLFGRNAKIKDNLPNVIAHGEQPIQKLTAYIQHADIGIAPYRQAPNCEYLSQSSLKMIQYTYCKLPIVAPEFSAQGRKNVMTYDPNGDEKNIIDSFSSAISYDRQSISANLASSWEDVLREMLKEKIDHDF